MPDHTEHRHPHSQHDHGHKHHHDHEHTHGGIGHVHAPARFGRAFAIGIALNTAFVVFEATYGYIGMTVALMADAGHNLSDVLGLVFEAGADGPSNLRHAAFIYPGRAFQRGVALGAGATGTDALVHAADKFAVLGAFLADLDALTAAAYHANGQSSETYNHYRSFLKNRE